MSIDPRFVYGDAKVLATGVHSAGVTTWTPAAPVRVNRARVLASGALVTLTRVSDTEYTAAGNFAGPAVLYAITETFIVPSEIVAKDDQGMPMIDRDVSLRNVAARMDRHASVRINVAGAVTASSSTQGTPSPFAGPARESRSTRLSIGANASQITVTMRALDDHYFSVEGVEFEGSIRRRFFDGS